MVTMAVGVSSSSGEVDLDDGIVKIAMTVRAGNGLVVVPDANGRIRVHRNMEIGVAGDGFKPNSLVVVTLLPAQLRVGEVLTDANGSFSDSLPLPGKLELGEHNVKMDGVDVMGQPREMALGLEVVDESVPLNVMRPVAEFTLANANLGAMLAIFIVLGGFWLLIARRKEERIDYVDVFRLQG